SQFVSPRAGNRAARSVHGSARTALGADPWSNEQPRRVAEDIGGMPDAGRIYCIFAGPERDADLLSVDFLDQVHRSFEADHDLRARGMHFPACPVLREAETGDQPTVLAVVIVTSAVILVPLHRPLIAREFGLRNRGAAAAEMDRMGFELARGHCVT